MSNSVIELEPLKPLTLKDDSEVSIFTRIVKTYDAAYFNLADLPLLELYAKTYKEINHLYDVLKLSGSIADEKNKKYEQVSRLIDAKVKQLQRLGTSLRINPQQRRAASTHRQDDPEDMGREPKASGRDGITHNEVWPNE